MVTIRRVMEPFGAEPTVTISIKGSSPDKDDVLFMLDHHNPTLSGIYFLMVTNCFIGWFFF